MGGALASYEQSRLTCLLSRASRVRIRNDVTGSQGFDGTCSEKIISPIMTKFVILNYELTKSQHTKGKSGGFPTARPQYGDFSRPM